MNIVCPNTWFIVWNCNERIDMGYQVVKEHNRWYMVKVDGKENMVVVHQPITFYRKHDDEKV